MQRAVEGRRVCPAGFSRRYPDRGPPVLFKLLQRVNQPVGLFFISGRVAWGQKSFDSSL